MVFLVPFFPRMYCSNTANSLELGKKIVKKKSCAHVHVLTRQLTSLGPQGTSTDDFYVVQKRRLAYFEALKLPKDLVVD